MFCTLCSKQFSVNALLHSCSAESCPVQLCSRCAAQQPAPPSDDIQSRRNRPRAPTTPGGPCLPGAPVERSRRTPFAAPRLVLPPVSRAPLSSSSSRPAPAFPPVPPGGTDPGASPSVSSLSVLHLLYLIPPMLQTTTLLYPPHHLADKFASHYSDALWTFVSLAQDPAATTDAQMQAALLAKWLPAILLHIPRTEDVGTPSMQARTAVRRRLQLADLGQWAPLIQELLDADSEAVRAASASTRTVSAATARISKFTAVCRKVQGRCLRSAAQILTGNGQPPPTPQTASAIEDLFLLSDEPLDYAAHMQQSLAELSKVKGWTPALRLLSRRTANLRAAAQPGPSKARNTHLKVCMRSRWGPQTLLEWCRLWCSGSVPLHMAEPFLHGWIAHFNKPNNRGIRPIALFEGPLKLATGLLLEFSTELVAKRVSPYQFGIGVPAGAEVMLRCLQALALALPEYVFLGH